MRTIPDALDAAAELRPEGACVFTRDDGVEEFWTYPKLRARAREVASALMDRGLRKSDRVALILPDAQDFVPTFLGVSLAGGVPVPLYPPLGLGQLEGYLDHCRHIVSASRASLLVTTPLILPAITALQTTAPELTALITPSELIGDEALLRAPRVELDDPGFIQFTSGSTSRPKGVCLSHSNLAHNARAIMVEGLRSDETDRGVSWLPLFHDMGLIGFVIAPMMHRVPVTFMPPMSFLKRPAQWLRALSRHKGTITYAPNFAYALTVRRVRDDELEGLDLSCVRVAGCGAEPVQPSTLRAFAKRFAPYGFREEAFMPSYGMAESSLAVCFGRGLKTDRVRAQSLWGQGLAEPCDTADSVEVVSCGKAFEGHEIKLVDPLSFEVLGERRVGEVLLKGPSVTSGYFEDPEKTHEAFSPEGYLRTGDLAYLADGELHLCGRRKDLIIVNGKNYYPHDLEWVVARVDGLRGSVAAFSTHIPGIDREAVVVALEAREADAERVSNAVRVDILRQLGLVVDRVVVTRVGSIPRTSSGKVQRSKTRALFDSGALGSARDLSEVPTSEDSLGSQRLGIFGREGSL